jgi:hypothetical protein
MTKEAKNEIDLMLRQLGRRDEGAAYDGGARDGAAYDGAAYHGAAYSGEQHLDADELNSYVANAWPPGACARYMEHLADCSSCRRLIAQLCAAQGPVVVEHTGSMAAPSGLKHLFANLFSPMVLRYAVPALGVIMIMVVGFVVMRRGPSQEFVATITESNQKRPGTLTASPSQPAPEGFIGQQAGHPAESATQKASPLMDQSSGTARSAEQPTSVAVTADQPPISTPGTGQVQNAPTPGAPPAPKVASTEAEDAERRADREKKATADTVGPAKLGEVTVKQGEEQKEAQRRAIAATPGPAVSRSGERGRFATGVEPAGAGAKRTRDEKTAKDDAAKEKNDAANEKNEAAAETRSVAGRRFRKSGSVWIDTAYDDSQQTFSLTRGSEQYRVLVADEPEIRRIAEQLDGEFIVVWKSRAYRIR